MKYSQGQPPKILNSLNILKPNLQKYWSIEIFSSPTSKNIKVLKYFQAQPPGPAKAKTLLQTEINIVLVSGKYFNCHCRGLYEIFWISFFLKLSYRSVRLCVSEMSRRAWFRTFSPGFVLMIRSHSLKKSILWKSVIIQ